MHHRRTYPRRTEPSDPGTNRKPVRAGIKPAPTRRWGRVCRGGLYIRPCAPPRRTHRRQTHSVGADAHIGPLGTDIISTITERAIVGVRIARPHPGMIYAEPALDVLGSGRIFNPPLQPGRRTVRSAVCLGPGGWRADMGIGPYEKAGSRAVGADCISALGRTAAEHTP